VPLAPEPEWVESIKASIPELPTALRRRLIEDHGLPEYDAEVITADRDIASYYEKTVAAGAAPKAASNWLMSEIMGYLNEQDMPISHLQVSSEMLAELLTLIDEGAISGKIAKDVFAKMAESGEPADQIIAERGWGQISDKDRLAKLVEEAIARNPEAVEDFKSGKEKAIGALVGYIMGQTKGQANPQLVNQMLREKLAER